MKYVLKYQDKLPEPVGELQVEMVAKFKELQREALGIFINKNNHFKSEFIKHGIPTTKIMMGHKFRDLDNGGKIITGKESESLTECFLDVSNYALMGAIQSAHDLKVQKKSRCDKCVYEIESRDGEYVALRCTTCLDSLKLKE